MVPCPRRATASYSRSRPFESGLGPKTIVPRVQHGARDAILNVRHQQGTNLGANRAHQPDHGAIWRMGGRRAGKEQGTWRCAM